MITPLLALVNLGWTGLTSVMVWPLAQPQTTDSINTIKPKRDQRAMFTPPSVNWRQ